TTARRRPALLRCGARYAADPSGFAPEVVIVLPDGEEISSADPGVHARLSELVGSKVRLEPIPPPSDKDAYRAPRETKADIRSHFGLAEDEPLPDLSVFPLRKLAELSRYVTPVGSLFDAYPVHVITRASLAAMAALTPGSDFDVRRFRPNLSSTPNRATSCPRTAGATPTSTCRTQVCTARSPRCVASCLPASSASSRQTSK
ncbi:MAG TPA: MOSC domain-containing protein, partial [Mycobacterium sp.]|nr:MOSC domain-containing protein [Mycobacterium sp.]